MRHIEYLSCPFCSRNLLLSKINVEEMDKLDKDPATQWYILQVREARGRTEGIKAAGFWLVPEESKTIVEMLDDERLRPYALGVLQRLRVIIDSYDKAGLLREVKE